jgi:hypothetical protein
VYEMKRKELMHLETVVNYLEMSRSDRTSGASCIIFSSVYWRSRVLAIRGSNSEADIEARTRKLLDRLSALMER